MQAILRKVGPGHMTIAVYAAILLFALICTLTGN